ncbi:Abi-alpha family protein [uncultured Halovibrio sp.]|uniref:Abi-alpha family protein n=1 Tax=uncultured Halovibrio sp. TaxID=985049 RepID=UPI0025DDD48B|nr:Abi-alpha family protein [uncultured Halovibrio sp.]
MSEKEKIIDQIAEASGKTADAVREMVKLIDRVIGGPLEEAAGIWQDKLKYTRAVNQLKLRDRFQDHLARRGLSEPTRAVPLSFAVPLLQAATLEEDEYLRDMWAAMLTNAADERVEVELRRAFVSLLEDMTSLDAQILKVIGDAPPLDSYSEALQVGFYIGYLPEKAAPMDNSESGQPFPSKEVFLSVSNLLRLNLLRTSDTLDGIRKDLEVDLTYLGEELLRLCSTELEQGE